MKERFEMFDESDSILQHLSKEKYALRRKFESSSPILTIQKNVSMFF